MSTVLRPEMTSTTTRPVAGIAANFFSTTPLPLEMWGPEDNHPFASGNGGPRISILYLLAGDV
jgi:hypothetical protein